MFGSRRGSATLMVLGTVAALMILTTGFIMVFVSSQARAIRSKNDTIALNLAEAGVDKALAELAGGNRKYQGEERTTMQTGSFTVVIDGVKGNKNRSVITSTGHPGNGNNPKKDRTVQVEIAFRGTGRRFRINSMQWKKVHPSDK